MKVDGFHLVPCLPSHLPSVSEWTDQQLEELIIQKLRLVFVLLSRPHLDQNLWRHDVCAINVGIPNGAFPTLVWFPWNKWWRHLNYRKDRVIHQAPIKAFRWRQHYRAVFLRDDREGVWNLLKTNLSLGIIFIFMMTLQSKTWEAKHHIIEPLNCLPLPLCSYLRSP